jgi:hypothetical protein
VFKEDKIVGPAKGFRDSESGMVAESAAKVKSKGLKAIAKLSI